MKANYYKAMYLKMYCDTLKYPSRIKRESTYNVK